MERQVGKQSPRIKLYDGRHALGRLTMALIKASPSRATPRPIIIQLAPIS